MNGMKTVAVLMTCYNRRETTLRCLAKLHAQKLSGGSLRLSVFVVDDGSTDGTGSAIENWWMKTGRNDVLGDVKVVYGDGNLYWCRGMRVAWNAADHSGLFDYYWWLNDDLDLNDNALQMMLNDSRFLSDQAIIVGICSEKSDVGSVVSYGLCDRKFQRICPVGHPKMGYEWMNGNCVLIPHSVYAKVGKIYGGYLHAYGDHDYGYKAMKLGIELYTSSSFVGVCARQPSRYEHLIGRGVLGRIKLLASPKGYNLHDAVVYKYRRCGLCGAILTFLHVIYIVVFAPGKGVAK